MPEQPDASNPHLRKDGRLRGETLRIKTPRTAASFTVEQRLEELLRIADKIEFGTATPIDEIALKAHLRVLAGRGLVAYEEHAITKATADVGDSL